MTVHWHKRHLRAYDCGAYWGTDTSSTEDAAEVTCTGCREHLAQEAEEALSCRTCDGAGYTSTGFYDANPKHTKTCPECGQRRILDSELFGTS